MQIMAITSPQTALQICWSITTVPCKAVIVVDAWGFRQSATSRTINFVISSVMQALPMVSRTADLPRSSYLPLPMYYVQRMLWELGQSASDRHDLLYCNELNALYIVAITAERGENLPMRQTIPDRAISPTGAWFKWAILPELAERQGNTNTFAASLRTINVRF